MESQTEERNDQLNLKQEGIDIASDCRSSDSIKEFAVANYSYAEMYSNNSQDMYLIRSGNDQGNEENESANMYDNSETVEHYKWTHHMIMLMLQKRMMMESQFNKPTCKKIKLWQQVAHHMAQHNYAISKEMCDSKYRNLLATYKKNKKKQTQIGEGAVTWPYFEIMDAVLSNKASNNVPTETLYSTLTTSAAQCNSIDVADDPVEQNVESSSGVLKIPKRRRKDAVLDYFRLKSRILLDEQEKRELRWREELAMRQKEVDAINSLATALACRRNKLS